MPTYEYRCPEGHDFEHFFRTIREGKSELDCPVCGKVASRRVSAGAGLLFKGSGFYITDYGKDGKKDQRKPAGEGQTPEGAPEKKREGETTSSGGGEKPAESAASAKKEPAKRESKDRAKNE
jgi:putative FmdB family regulatory protein